MRTKKSLGKILLGVSEKESPKKISIVDMINEACAHGITESERFSITNIKRRVCDLLDLLEAEEFNRDAFFLTFFQFYNAVMAPDGRAKGVFHPSQLLDGCERKMFFEISKTPPTDETSKVISGELQRIFDVGTWYHIYMQAILFRLGLLKKAEVPIRNKELYLNGKADGLFHTEVFGEPVVLEIKTMNSWTFKKAIFRPFKKHEFQASLYAREIGAKKILYLYINKDTSELKEFLVDTNKEELSAADKKMGFVISCKEADALPKRKCSDRLCDEAIQCPFVSLCFKHTESL